MDTDFQITTTKTRNKYQIISKGTLDTGNFSTLQTQEIPVLHTLLQNIKEEQKYWIFKKIIHVLI
jgi:hypothetical protein